MRQTNRQTDTKNKQTTKQRKNEKKRCNKQKNKSYKQLIATNNERSRQTQLTDVLQTTQPNYFHMSERTHVLRRPCFTTFTCLKVASSLNILVQVCLLLQVTFRLLFERSKYPEPIFFQLNSNSKV